MGDGGRFMTSSHPSQCSFLLGYLNFNTDLSQDVRYEARRRRSWEGTVPCKHPAAAVHSFLAALNCWFKANCPELIYFDSRNMLYMIMLRSHAENVRKTFADFLS